MENELIKIETKDGRQVVSARELYIGIGFDLSDGNFSRWIKKQLEDVDAVENEDYFKFVFKNDLSKTGQIVTDYIITVDIAKEICMVIGVAPRCKDEVKQKSKRIRKYFIECEKQLKEVNQKPQLSPQEQLALQLFNGGIDAITAHKQLLALETKELNERIIGQQETIEEKETEIKQLSPLAETLIKRFEKGNNIGWTDVSKTFGLKRGQASKWAVSNGYIYKSKKDVTSKGDKYFQRYLYNGHKCICITPEGVQLIEQHLDEIKNI